MIKQLLVQNFQCHEKLKVDFDPGITTIVGSSDVGKSAILRALRWIATNQPSGNAFIRDGTNGVRVILKTDESKISRWKRGKENIYKIDNGPSLKAFGQGVPDSVKTILSTEAINWQGQHDPPFWFSATPGEVSRQLNSIIDLSVIDTTLSNVSSATRKAQTKLDLATERVKDNKKTAKDLEWVPQMVADLETLEQMLTEQDDLQCKSEELTKLIDAAKVIVPKPLPSMKALKQHKDKFNEVSRKKAELVRLLITADRHTKEITQLSQDLETAEVQIPNQCPTCGNIV